MFFWELHTGDFPIKIWYDFSLDDFGRRLLKIYCNWRDVAINFQKSSSKIIQTPLKPRGFRPSETSLKPSARFQTGFRLVWNHLFSPRDRVWRRPYEAKRIVSTDSGTPKSQKTTSFWHSTAGFPQRVASNMKKSQKPLSFWRFLAISLIFALSKKRPYEAKRIVSTILRTLSGTPKTQKALNFWHLTLVFPERGAPGTSKLAKNPQFLTLDSRIPAEGCSKNWKIAKTPQFLTLDTHFPWERLHRARFRDYWVALK